MNIVGIVIDGENILIGKVLQDKVKDFGGIEYIFPGGKVEENETPEKAVIREIQEETGLDARVITKIASRIHPKTGKEILYYHCEYVSGEISVDNAKNDDIESLSWVNAESIRKYMPSIFDKVLEYIQDKV